MSTDLAETLDLDAIRNRADAACPGPWQAYDGNEGSVDYGPLWAVANDAFHNPPADDNTPWIAVEIHVGLQADAEFIAHARHDVPALLAEVARLKAALSNALQCYDDLQTAAGRKYEEPRARATCHVCPPDDQHVPCPVCVGTGSYFSEEAGDEAGEMVACITCRGSGRIAPAASRDQHVPDHDMEAL